MSRAAVKARIVAIGNSQGIRIPKPLLEQAGLTGEGELHAEDGRIVIAAARRRGAREAAGRPPAALHARGEDGLLDTPAPAFDHEEWDWRWLARHESPLAARSISSNSIRHESARSRRRGPVSLFRPTS